MWSIILRRIVVSVAATVATLRYGAGFYAWRVAEKLEQPVYTIVQKLTDGVEIRRYESYLVAETILTTTTTIEQQPTAAATKKKENSQQQQLFSARDGFRTCASYIFGKNRKVAAAGGGGSLNEKMKMTAPVRVAASSSSCDDEGVKMAMTTPVRVLAKPSSKKAKVSFVIGSEYTLSNVPRPIDKNVTIREIPVHYAAVRTFSGPPPTDERVGKERSRINAALEKANLVPASSSLFSFLPSWLSSNNDDNDDTLVYGYHDPFITPNFLRRNEVLVTIDAPPNIK